jgi:hypothetical protein
MLGALIHPYSNRKISIPQNAVLLASEIEESIEI